MPSRVVAPIVLLLLLISRIHGFHEDPYKVLGITRSASDAEIKRAYRLLALKWHPDKNRSDPMAKQQFMRIGAAYEKLINPIASTKPQQWRQQQHRKGYQQKYARGYDYQTQYQKTVSLDLTTPLLIILALAALLGVFGLHPIEKVSSTPSQFNTVATTFAPSSFEFKSLYLTAKGRRTLIFFPDETHGCSVEDQFKVIEKFTKEFQHDPLTFCWMNLHAQSKEMQSAWQKQFKSTATPFVVSLSYRGQKISLLPSRQKSYDGREALEKEVRSWLLRLSGGEISQNVSSLERFE
ncbi:hypothetical protein CCR75_000563 [Bremia lactucae]|uniref:J domain-containing protein n=1 Tax=Bremia lactucae TaxID=4779 RepID=A0A976NZ17_BRELC|nr:hypothetical protein CCR75_000563 [Bremia lactucae]